MGTHPNHQHFFRFGVFELDRRAGELRKNGLKVHLQEQPFQILAMLVEQPGDVVTREELRQKLWADDTFVDFDQGLNRAVNKIREALGDSATNPRFVETLPRRGYRFIAPVQGSSEAESRPSSPTARPAQPPASRKRWYVGAAVLAVGLVLGAAAGSRFLSPIAPEPLVAVPLTSYPGLEMNPSFSPDGSQVAFSWNGPNQDNFDIYVTVIGGAEPRWLTNKPSKDYAPAWSPDGRWIAFLRELSNGEAEIRLISPVGGAESCLGKIMVGNWSPSSVIQGHYLAWTPDGKWLAVQDRESVEEPFHLSLLSLESGEWRQITDLRSPAFGDFCPTFSWDSRSLAFVRLASRFELRVLRLDKELRPEGEPRILVSDRRQKRSPSFTPDGDRLVYSSGEWADPDLWEVSLTRSSLPRKIPFVGDGGILPAVSRQGNRLAYTRLTREWRIWQIERTGRGAYSEPVKLLESTRFEKDPQLSPDASKIAFASTRSGHPEIWVANGDGSEPHPLTSFRGPAVGSPRWSPDGKTLAFDSGADGNLEIYVVNSEGGAPKRVTTHAAVDHRPSWSQDGKWIYFASTRSGENQVWKVAADGGQREQVTRGGGFDPFESPGGRFVYYVRADDTLWKIPASGGTENQMCDSCRIYNWNSSLGVVEGGIYFFDPRPDAEGQYSIKFLDLASGEQESVTTIDDPRLWGLGASRDGRSIVYSRVDQQKADLMLVENFR